MACPVILNGKIDILIEMRRKNWIARAWGVAIGQWFFGIIVFKRVPKTEDALKDLDDPDEPEPDYEAYRNGEIV